MSSDKKGVQAEIARCVPDAEYQGCCLLSINLVICHACKIKSIQNMMDYCHELFSFFDNSPKRQKFLSIVIDALSPENKKHRLKDLYESRGPPCLKQFSNCMNTVSLCWMRDVYPQMMTSGFTQTTKNGAGMPKLRQWQIVNFIWAKEMLEPATRHGPARQASRRIFWFPENWRNDQLLYCQILNKKWGHLIPLPSSFKSELFRWINYWECQASSDYESISVSTLLAKRANNIFFPNIRELKILAVLPVGSTGRRGRFLLFGGPILGFATQWPPNNYQIYPSSPWMQI